MKDLEALALAAMDLVDSTTADTVLVGLAVLVGTGLALVGAALHLDGLESLARRLGGRK